MNGCALVVFIDDLRSFNDLWRRDVDVRIGGKGCHGALSGSITRSVRGPYDVIICGASF